MEQRRHARENSAAPAILRVDGRPGGFLVTILDFSKSGLRVSCSSSVHEGRKVSITYRGRTLNGIARYCRPVTSDEFHIGVEADALSPGLTSDSGELDVTIMFRPGGKTDS